MCQLQSLKSAVSDIGRNIHLEHLLLVSDCLSVTGEFHGLSTKGLKQQKAHLSISSPFTQACFSVSSSSSFFHTFMYSWNHVLSLSNIQWCFVWVLQNPGKCLIEAGKQGSVDHLYGTLDAVAWGKEAPVGTGGPFEIMYSGQVFLELMMFSDVCM